MGNINAENNMVRFWNEQLSPLIRHIVTTVGSLALSVTLIWTVTEPHVEIFIRKVVAQERFASQSALDSIDNRMGNLERAVKDLLMVQQQQAQVQSRLDADMSIVKELQKEQREDTKSILKLIR